MNLRKQNSKSLHVNIKHQICPSDIRSPEMVSGTFLKWIPSKNHVPRGTMMTVQGSFVAWWAPNIHSLSPGQEVLELDLVTSLAEYPVP